MATDPRSRSRVALGKLSRRELQAVAKEEGLKANGKTSSIIDNILQRFPGGIPRFLKRRASRTPVFTSIKRVTLLVKPQIKEEEGEDTDNPGKRRRLSKYGCRTPASEIESFGTPEERIHAPAPPEERYCTPYPGAVKAPAQQPSASQEPMEGIEATNAEVLAIHPLVNPARAVPVDPKTASMYAEVPLLDVFDLEENNGPDKKEVRYLRRGLTKLIDTTPQFREELSEMELLLQHVQKIADDVIQGLGDIDCTLQAIEQVALRNMKDDRTIWDGTPFMQKEEKAEWRKFLQEVRRAEGKGALSETDDEDVPRNEHENDGARRHREKRRESKRKRPAEGVE